MAQIGAYFLAWEELKIEDKISIFKNLGFNTVALQMSGVDGSRDNRITPELAEKNGFTVQNVHLTGSGTSEVWFKGSKGDEIVERYCREIKLCASKGIKIGITHVTWGYKHGIPPLDPIAIERFKRIIDCAEKNKFILALENSAFEPHLRYVLDDLLDSDATGFCYDTGHRYCFMPKADLIGDYGDRLVAMHLDDNDGIDDLHLIPYDGIAPWDEIIADLEKTKLYYDNIIFEVKGKIRKECPGMSAGQIYDRLSGVKIRDDSHLMKIYDGGFEVYQELDYEEYLDRVMQAAKKILKIEK